ncbi:MAG TPA: hypothetical protein VE733_00020 [Streptosporangiaceae bacterium]|nr:hypothetical protein [Streptosporangiaceae bacterium]
MIEVRPIAPAGRLSPATRAVLSKSVVRADPRAGTLLLAEPHTITWAPARRTVLPLPSTGRPDAVAAVRVVSYARRVNARTYPLWRVLLVGRDGQVLASGRPRDEDLGRQMWPAELFAPLEQVGIGVAEERFADSGELDRAHPGASPHSQLGTGPRPALIGFAAAVIILVIIGVAVYLATR